MKIHKLKTINPYFEEVWEGRKTFEVRLNDRDFQVGDEVYLQEYNLEWCEYSGRQVRCDITYILKDYPALIENNIVFGIKTTQFILTNP